MPKPSQQAHEKVARENPDLVARADIDDAAAARLWRLAVAQELIWQSGVETRPDAC